MPGLYLMEGLFKFWLFVSGALYALNFCPARRSFLPLSFLFSFPCHAGPKILIDFSVLKGKAGVDPGPIWNLSEPDPVSVFHVSV